MKRRRSSTCKRGGMVLLVVLVVITILSLAAYSFADFMLVERQAAMANGQARQAQALAESGVVWVQETLRKTDTQLQEEGGIYSNSTLFSGQLVANGADPRDRGLFTITSPAMSSGVYAGLRHGLEDDSGRLNLDFVLAADKARTNGGRLILMALPGMTEDVADAILDWIDTDSTVRPQGAEADHYAGAIPPCAPRNGPVDTIEELLLVRGVTPELLFGADVNRNGMLDTDESPMPVVEGTNNASGSLDLGWASYLTLYSAEANTQADGSERINLNDSDLEQLHKDLSSALSEDLATFIVVYRQFGKVQQGQGDQTRVPQLASGRRPDFEKEGSTKLESILDLVDIQVDATFSGATQPILVVSPLSVQGGTLNKLLPDLMEKTTTVDKPRIPGRINVNVAPRAALAGLPGMTAAILDGIIAQRGNPDDVDASHRHATWLLVEGIVTIDAMKQLMPYLNGGGRVFRFQVAGHFEAVGPTTRAEAVVDATEAIPRLLFWRELSHLGRGQALDAQGQGSL